MRLLALAVVTALAAPAWAADEVVLPPTTRVTFENGMRVVVAETHELPLVEFAVMVGAGAAQDPAGQEGLAALTAATLTRGAGSLNAPELARAIDSLGGNISAAAGTDATVLGAEFLAEDVARGLELLRSVLREPRFEKDEVRRAKEQQLAELVADLENPSQVAEQCFAAFLYGSHPYGRMPEGRRATVSGLDRGDVRDYYGRWYRPNNVILVIVGDVSTDDAIARLRAAFGDWPARPDAVPVRAGAPAPVTARRVLLVDKSDATQTQLRAGATAMARNDPDLLPSQVANTILGGGFSSRLIEELRVKRSLTYGASSGFSARLTGGDFRISTFTKAPTTVETLQLALQVEGGFRGQAPDPKALEKAKAYLRGQFPLRVETPDALASRLAEIEFFGLPPDELTTYRSRVAAVTGAEAARMTEQHMPQPEDVAIVVVGPAADVKPALEAAYGAVRVVTPEQCEALTP